MNCVNVFLVKPTLVVFRHIDEVGQSLFLNNRDSTEMSGNSLEKNKMICVKPINDTKYYGAVDYCKWQEMNDALIKCD